MDNSKKYGKCKCCDTDLKVACIRQNWYKLGPIMQLCRQKICWNLRDKIASYLITYYHIVVSEPINEPIQSYEEHHDILYTPVQYKVCRLCLLSGIEYGLCSNERLPYLRAHVNYFTGSIGNPKFSKYLKQRFDKNSGTVVATYTTKWTDYINDISLRYTLPKIYRLCYNRTPQPVYSNWPSDEIYITES